MLTKEYRIPLPLSVEEYRVAQLYMIAKKSREESQGVGSGVEILVNEPYTDGPSGSKNGQYTQKVYHVGQHLPGWLKAVLPKSALIVEEEAWNAYPYTKTRYKCPFVEKFFIEIETKYFNDGGHQENVFQLDSADLRNRIVDVIDIVKDQLYGSDYLKQEDPKYYVSEKTKRGPLSESWVQEHWDSQCNGDTTKAIMCAYKLIRVEFKYWGLQTKVEKFIHDYAMRRIMLRAHRQAWAWQDEWFGLTMEDIRRLEKETQEALARKMAKSSDHMDSCDDNDPNHKPVDSRRASKVSDSNKVRGEDDFELSALKVGIPKNKNLLHLSNTNETDQNLRKNELCKKHWPRSNSRSSVQSPGYNQNCEVHWWMSSIASESDTTSNEDFYDAEDVLGANKGSLIESNISPTRKNTQKSENHKKYWSTTNSKAGLHSCGERCFQNTDSQSMNWRVGSFTAESEISTNDEFFDAEEMLDSSSVTKWSSLEYFPVDESLTTPEALDSEEHLRKNVATSMDRASVDASPSHKTCFSCCC